MSLQLPRSTWWGLAIALLIPSAGFWQFFRGAESQRAGIRALRAELYVTAAEREAVQARIDDLSSELNGEPQPEPDIASDAGRSSRAKPAVVEVPSGRTPSPTPAAVDTWAKPPDSLPEWNLNSPYIWLSKDSLTKLPIPALGSRGSIDGSMAELFGIPPELAKDLNAATAEVFRRLESLESELATATTPSEKPNSLQLQIQIPTAAMSELKSSFEEAFHRFLGPQRAEIILGLGRSWSDEVFSLEKSFTVTLLPGDTYEIASSGGGIYRSFGGTSSLDGLLPSHLTARFKAHFDSIKRGRADGTKPDENIDAARPQ